MAGNSVHIGRENANGKQMGTILTIDESGCLHRCSLYYSSSWNLWISLKLVPNWKLKNEPFFLFSPLIMSCVSLGCLECISLGCCAHLWRLQCSLVFPELFSPLGADRRGLECPARVLPLSLGHFDLFFCQYLPLVQCLNTSLNSCLLWFFLSLSLCLRLTLTSTWFSSCFLPQLTKPSHLSTPASLERAPLWWSWKTR